jgi:hypothetical protein
MTFAPIITPSSRCIKRLIDVYERDHNWVMTKQHRMYYIKNIMPFDIYYWITRTDSEDFMFGPSYYDKFEDYDDDE